MVETNWKNTPCIFYISVDDRSLVALAFGLEVNAKGAAYKNLLVKLAKEKTAVKPAV